MLSVDIHSCETVGKGTVFTGRAEMGSVSVSVQGSKTIDADICEFLRQAKGVDNNTQTDRRTNGQTDTRTVQRLLIISCTH